MLQVPAYILFFFTLAVFLYSYAIFARLPLPPALRSIDESDHPWKLYSKQARNIGPLAIAKLWGTPVVLVNTRRAALDLLSGRLIYASKPRWPMAELIGRENSTVGFTYYGERLKKFRTALKKSFNLNTVQGDWMELLETCSTNLCDSLQEDPQHFYNIIERKTQELMNILAYGYTPDTAYLELHRQVLEDTAKALTPGKWSINNWPCLKYIPSWLPGAGFKRWASIAKNRFNAVLNLPFHQAKLDISSGRAKMCFVKNALEDLNPHYGEEDEDIVRYAAGSLLTAGAETLSSAICTFLAMMSCHTDIQQRAYEQIHTVVGPLGMPSLRDRSRLSLIDCIIKEVYRINPSVPFIVRSNFKADVYSGYRIPRDSWVVANIWGMLHDPEIYEHPEKFVPDRFTSVDSTDSQDIKDPRCLVFGFGARRCPGEHVAETFLFLVISRILKTFQILPPPNDESASIHNLGFRSGIISHPKPFRCHIKLREKIDSDALASPTCV